MGATPTRHGALQKNKPASADGRSTTWPKPGGRPQGFPLTYLRGGGQRDIVLMLALWIEMATIFDHQGTITEEPPQPA